MSEFRVLIVEDDREMRASLVDLLEAAGWESVALARAMEVAKTLPEFRPDVILSDVRMPGMTGLELLAKLEGPLVPPVVLISAHGDIPTAVEAMQRGAYSFVEKPYEPRRLLTVLRHAAEQHRMRQDNAQLRERLLQFTELDRVLIGVSPEIAGMRDEITDLAQVEASVLILGETGCGKELVARALHDLGPRAGHPFVALNAADISSDQLFQLVAQADGGTVFFDEITACPLDQQASLLRLAEVKEHKDPKSGRIRKFDIRLLSATNEDLEDAIAQKQFRKDLYFRLATTTLTLPPLRKRRDDIPLLAAHFLGQMAQSYNIAVPELTEDDFMALLAYEWPGNVRELRNICERRVLMARRGLGSMALALAPGEAEYETPHTLREAVAAFERQLIGKAIRAHEGRMDAVAEALGIGRRTLNEKIVKLGLDKEAFL